MDNPQDKQKQPDGRPRFSKEQYDMLMRCSASKNITEWNNWRDENPDEEILLVGAEFRKAHLIGANLVGADLGEGNLGGADLSGANLTGANLKKAQLVGTKLNGATLFKANLCDLTFNGVRLVDTSLLSVEVNKRTKFEDTKGTNKTSGCRINRYILESLEDYGGLTKGDRMKMTIIDDVATLRLQFSGFWHWVHLVGMAAFLFPYVWFTVKQWMIAKFTIGDDSNITLLEALCRYIVSGGQGWREGWNINYWLVTVFIIALFYNVLRGLLFYKTKTLELQETISGLPCIFSLQQGFWKWIYMMRKYFLVAFMIAVAWNTIHFLMMRIPVTQ